MNKYYIFQNQEKEALRKQKRSNFSLCIVTAVLFALTVCGSIWDLDIANAVYIGETPSENMFGIIFSCIGPMPTFVGWSFLGASLFYISKNEIADTKKRRQFTALAILLFVFSFFYFCNTLYFANANVFKMHFTVAYSIGILIIGIAAYFGYKLSEKSEDGELLKKVLFLAAVSLVTVIIISSTKEIMCRPRYRFVLAMEDIDFFRSWWQSGRSLKASLGDVGITDEFASLPSGHSAYSMFAIFLFPVLADYVRGINKFKPYFFALGFIWWGATAFSRMTTGAHYLTDVTIAGLVTIFAYIIVSSAKTGYLKLTSRKLFKVEKGDTYE